MDGDSQGSIILRTQHRRAVWLRYTMYMKKRQELTSSITSIVPQPIVHLYISLFHYGWRADTVSMVLRSKWLYTVKQHYICLPWPLQEKNKTKLSDKRNTCTEVLAITDRLSVVRMNVTNVTVGYIHHLWSENSSLITFRRRHVHGAILWSGVARRLPLGEG